MADLSKDVLAFCEEFARMCEMISYQCKRCPAHELNACDGLNACDITNITPELIGAVQKWSDEHTGKTYAWYFRTRNPDWGWDDDYNIPDWICRNYVFGIDKSCDINGISCAECWNERMEEGEYVESWKELMEEEV